MADLDDDPYLAELLDLTNDELGDDVGDAGGKKTAAATATASSSQASASASASAAKGGAGSGAAVASSQQSATSLPSPGKASSSYRSSETHRETLKLLSQLSPSMAKLPSAAEVRAAFQQLYPDDADDNDDDDGGEEGDGDGDGDGDDEAGALDGKAVQRALEEHLDVADLGPRLGVIEEEMARWREARAESRRRRRLQGGPQCLSQSLSQQSLGDELSQTANGSKKRKRVAVPGGKSELPLVLPKGLTCGGEGGKGPGKGPKSLLVELDERDRGQDLTGDSGAVGRVHVSKKRGMVLDLKGHQYLASMTRCPALLLVSVGEEEAKVEDVVENLCVLTHLRNQLEAMGGRRVKGGGSDDGSYRGSDDEDYSRWNSYGDGDADAKGKGGGKGGKKKGGGGGGGGGRAVATTARKKGKGAGGKKGGSGGGGSRKSGGGGKAKGAAGKAKKAGPTKVSLKALKPKGKAKPKKKKAGSDDDSDESESSFSEPDDDDDSDFSI